MKKENRKDVNKNRAVTLNLIQGLLRLLLSLRNGVRGRFRIKYGMTPNFMGFTLIELLVVVLIIGILAAVALPQYQKAVLKARYTQLMAFGNAIEKAAIAYHLANGKYPARFDEMDIDLPMTGAEGTTLTTKTYKDYACTINAGRSNMADGIICSLTTPNGSLAYRTNYSGWGCLASFNWEMGNKICQNMTGRTTHTSTYGDPNYPSSYFKRYAF